jgi:hypothetical protein
VPLANIGSPLVGQILLQPSATTYVREGVVAGPLETVDTSSAQNDFRVSTSCP